MSEKKPKREKNGFIPAKDYVEKLDYRILADIEMKKIMGKPLSKSQEKYLKELQESGKK